MEELAFRLTHAGHGRCGDHVYCTLLPNVCGALFCHMFLFLLPLGVKDVLRMKRPCLRLGESRLNPPSPPLPVATLPSSAGTCAFDGRVGIGRVLVLRVVQLGSVDSYKILSQSDCATLDGVDDAEQFRAVKDAFDTIGMDEETQKQV